MKFDAGDFNENLLAQSKFSWSRVKLKGTLNEDLHAFVYAKITVSDSTASPLSRGESSLMTSSERQTPDTRPTPDQLIADNSGYTDAIHKRRIM
jgi:hypothetical protein